MSLNLFKFRLLWKKKVSRPDTVLSAKHGARLEKSGKSVSSDVIQLRPRFLKSSVKELTNGKITFSISICYI
jgi:hypothetical protein